MATAPLLTPPYSPPSPRWRSRSPSTSRSRSHPPESTPSRCSGRSSVGSTARGRAPGSSASRSRSGSRSVSRRLRADRRSRLLRSSPPSPPSPFSSPERSSSRPSASECCWRRPPSRRTDGNGSGRGPGIGARARGPGRDRPLPADLRSAAVESAAENLADGFVAPLGGFALGATVGLAVGGSEVALPRLPRGCRRGLGEGRQHARLDARLPLEAGRVGERSARRRRDVPPGPRDRRLSFGRGRIDRSPPLGRIVGREARIAELRVADGDRRGRARRATGETRSLRPQPGREPAQRRRRGAGGTARRRFRRVAVAVALAAGWLLATRWLPAPAG